jgi:hypothetical protein
MNDLHSRKHAEGIQGIYVRPQCRQALPEAGLIGHRQKVEQDLFLFLAPRQIEPYRPEEYTLVTYYRDHGGSSLQAHNLKKLVEGTRDGYGSLAIQTRKIQLLPWSRK